MRESNEYVDGTGEVAEQLADILDSLDWDGDEDFLYAEALKMQQRYPEIDPKAVAAMAKDIYNSYYGAKK